MLMILQNNICNNNITQLIMLLAFLHGQHDFSLNSNNNNLWYCDMVFIQVQKAKNATNFVI